MSITQTYYLAHTARGKLSQEAAKSDHNLRYLVGHANLLDSLMLELADAEQEQESWFNNSVRGAQKNERRHIQWADTVVEEIEEEEYVEDSSSSSDSDDYEEDIDVGFATLQRFKSHSSYSSSHEEDEEEYEDDGEEDYAMLSLQRTQSHPASPPELMMEFEEDSSEDEQMPPSPPTDSLPEFPKQKHQSKEQLPLFDDSFYLPQRASSSGLVSAIRVY